MKKSRVISKKYFAAAALIVCLAAAVWINMRYSTIDNYNGQKESGEDTDKQYISTDIPDEDAVKTSTGVSYIADARAQRNQSRTETLEGIKNAVNDSALKDEDKQKIFTVLTDSVKNSENEAAAETVIRSKGFEDALVIISDENITVIVPSENLLTSETLQIQDAVVSVTGSSLEKIKIIAVK